MPVSAYYKGDGKTVMADMQRRYGTKAGERMFYAVAASRGLRPTNTRRRRRRKRHGSALQAAMRPRADGASIVGARSTQNT